MKNEHIWQPVEDYAIAFASGLGMSSRNIATALGPWCTRNMVIGRRFRIGLLPKVDMKPVSTVRAKATPKAGTRPMQRRKRAWVPEEDQIVREHYGHVGTAAIVAMLPNRTLSAVQGKIGDLGLAHGSPKRRFTAAEDDLIRTQYAAHVHCADIAQALGRSIGTVRQRIHHLGLNRDGRKTRLAQRFGFEVLAIADDPAEIRRTMLETQRNEDAAAAAAHQAKIDAALQLMKDGITAGNDRATEMRAAMLAGATLQEVGDAVGITRERVRQIVHAVKTKHVYVPKPPRTIDCQECGTAFETKGQGQRKYCDGCRDTAKGAYMRKYMRERIAQSSLKEKMLAMDGNTLAEMLHEVAETVRRKQNEMG